MLMRPGMEEAQLAQKLSTPAQSGLQVLSERWKQTQKCVEVKPVTAFLASGVPLGLCAAKTTSRHGRLGRFWDLARGTVKYRLNDTRCERHSAETDTAFE